MLFGLLDVFSVAPMTGPAAQQFSSSTSSDFFSAFTSVFTSAFSLITSNVALMIILAVGVCLPVVGALLSLFRGR